MTNFKKLPKKISRFWWVAALILLIPSFNRLIHKGFFPTQDEVFIARIYEMDRSLKDGQFPVRWVPDFRYGEPLFNFYAPLPYYLGSIIHSFNIDFLDTSKILFILSLILSFFSMYFLGREIWGRAGGLISAFLYLYAPYRALDVFVRGDLSESWVFVFLPLIFWGALKLSREINGKNFAILALSLAGLFFTHNVMTMLIAPFFIIWILYLAKSSGNFKTIIPLFTSSILGVGIASSFLIPAYFEKNFIQVQQLTGGYFDFKAHFIEINQLFSTFWGYGASVWGGEDGMSFQLGLIHWVLLGLVLVSGLIKRKELVKNRKTTFVFLFLTFFLFTLFMQHNKSTFIWLAIPILQYVQFPWRFMGISIFFVAILSGSLALLLPKFKYLLAGLVIIFSIIANYNFFKPESYSEKTAFAHLYSKDSLLVNDELPKDYLPIWVKKTSTERITQPIIVNGIAEVSDYISGSSYAHFRMTVKEDSEVELPITFFPGWKVELNGKSVYLDEPSESGLIRFRVSTGQYLVRAYFGNTPLRTAGNIISCISLLILMWILVSNKFRLRKGR